MTRDIKIARWSVNDRLLLPSFSIIPVAPPPRRRPLFGFFSLKISHKRYFGANFWEILSLPKAFNNMSHFSRSGFHTPDVHLPFFFAL
jgi:hypothetical protein